MLCLRHAPRPPPPNTTTTHLAVPGQGRHLIPAAALHGRVQAGLAGVSHIPDAEVAISAAAGQQVGRKGVELQAAHWPCVLLQACQQSSASRGGARLGGLAAYDAGGIPQADAAICQPARDEAILLVCLVESVGSEPLVAAVKRQQ